MSRCLASDAGTRVGGTGERGAQGDVAARRRPGDDVHISACSLRAVPFGSGRGAAVRRDPRLQGRARPWTIPTGKCGTWQPIGRVHARFLHRVARVRARLSVDDVGAAIRQATFRARTPIPLMRSPAASRTMAVYRGNSASEIMPWRGPYRGTGARRMVASWSRPHREPFHEGFTSNAPSRGISFTSPVRSAPGKTGKLALPRVLAQKPAAEPVSSAQEGRGGGLPRRVLGILRHRTVLAMIVASPHSLTQRLCESAALRDMRGAAISYSRFPLMPPQQLDRAGRSHRLRPGRLTSAPRRRTAASRRSPRTGRS